MSRVGLLLLAAWLLLSPGMAWARDAQPVVRIPLAPLGYQPMVAEFLLDGSSMLTVDFVDPSHLLITFGLRRLMKREPDSQPDDEDRMVGASLVELPSGRLLAHTEWRLHDRGQYLWNLGNGRLLLRLRDRLSVIAPMAAASGSDPFRQIPLLRVERRIVALLLSSDKDLLTLETVKPPPPAGVASDVTVVDPPLPDSAQPALAPVQINFYRLSSAGETAQSLLPVSAGAMRARTAVDLPLTTSGFLELKQEAKDRWMFNFDAYTGTTSELSGFDTSCFPRTTFIGHGEFVAFGCRGSGDRQELAAFNLKGEEMWQQNFSNTHVATAFSFAPDAGRFALGRVVASGAFDPDGPLPQSVVNAQEVRVLQSYNGKLLFQSDCSPVERSGQNFALSPDGLQLAVVRERVVHHAATSDSDEYSEREAAVEVYALPPLSPQDREAIRADEAIAPEDTGAPINRSLQRIATPLAINAASTGSSSSVPATTPDDVAGSAADGKAEGATSAGDALQTPVRKPPTLRLPEEKPADDPAQTDRKDTTSAVP
jgi:hypothetical protein